MMDDEGTVVYFRTSPALEQQLSNDFAFNEDNSSPESIENDNSLSPAPPEGIGGVWRRLFYFSDVLTRHFKITPDFSCQDDECCRNISMVIRDSPLLTEEDYQLLYFALLKPRPQRILSQEESLGIISTSRKGAVFAVFVSVLAVCWVTQLSLPVSLLLMVLLVLLGCARPVVTSAVSTSHERSLQKARQTVTGYCREVEALLSLLSLCLRTVHEAEMVARQFIRPLVARNVPVEDGYQCLGLRCCLFSVCQRVVEGLRNATLLLSQQHPLNRDLDGSGVNYLSHSSLSSLHIHLTTNLDNISREDSRKHKCLSHESLKDAANLLAVQNSELLRHTALSLLSVDASGDCSGPFGTASGPSGSEIDPVGATSGPSGSRIGTGSGTVGCTGGTASGTCGSRKVSLLKFLASNLNQLREEVLKNRLKLEWGHDFHRNTLFGDPPERTVPEVSEETRSPAALGDLTRDLHSMDVRTQAALQRIRDLENLLAGNDKVEEPLRKCEEELSVIQRMVDAVSDQLEDCLSLIHRFQKPTEAHTGVRGDEGSGDEDSVEATTDGTPPSQDHLHKDGSSSSEDEKVFEGYVAAVDEGEETGVNGREGGGEVGPREKEVSAKMVRELEGVLAVRSERRGRERDERRRRRQRKRQEQRPDKDNRNTEEPRVLPTSENKETLNSRQSGRRTTKHFLRTSEDTEISSTVAGGVASSDDASTSATLTDPVNSVEIVYSSLIESQTAAGSYSKPTESFTSSTDTPEDFKPLQSSKEPPYPPLPTEGPLQEAGVPGQLAVRVAAIAARRRRGTVEETFGSDDETDTSQHSEPD